MSVALRFLCLLKLWNGNSSSESIALRSCRKCCSYVEFTCHTLNSLRDWRWGIFSTKFTCLHNWNQKNPVLIFLWWNHVFCVFGKISLKKMGSLFEAISFLKLLKMIYNSLKSNRSEVQALFLWKSRFHYCKMLKTLVINDQLKKLASEKILKYFLNNNSILLDLYLRSSTSLYRMQFFDFWIWYQKHTIKLKFDQFFQSNKIYFDFRWL